MKRISIWLVLSAFLAGSAEATYYIPSRYRVHYSPHALSYGHTGLIPGGLDYSLHAVNYGSSGLVYEGALYTPHALQYGGTGLVESYYVYIPAYPLLYGYPCPIINYNCYGSAPARHRHRAAPQDHYPSSPQDNEQEPPTTVGPSQSRQEDALNIIRQYLRDKNCADASINHILRFNNRLVSVDFTLRDRNLIIKYWNPKEVGRLSGAETQSRVPLYQQRVYEKYQQEWEHCARQHEAQGGEIYYVQACDRETIVPALQACPKLEASPLVPPLRFAKD